MTEPETPLASVAADLLEFAREHASPPLPIPYLWSVHTEEAVIEREQEILGARILIQITTWYGEPGRAKKFQNGFTYRVESVTNVIDLGTGAEDMKRQLRAMVESMMYALVKLGYDAKR
jgi:hypothetical protein